MLERTIISCRRDDRLMLMERSCRAAQTIASALAVAAITAAPRALAAAALAAATLIPVLIAAAFLIAAAGSSKGGSGESVCSVQHTHKHTAPDALR